MQGGIFQYLCFFREDFLKEVRYHIPKIARGLHNVHKVLQQKVLASFCRGHKQQTTALCEIRAATKVIHKGLLKTVLVMCGTSPWITISETFLFFKILI